MAGNFWQKPENAFFWSSFKVYFKSPAWQIFTIFLACFTYGILNTHTKYEVSKSKTVVTREWSRQGSKFICLQNLRSKFYLTKIFLKNSFWTHIPSTMFWQCILSPYKFFSFQTVFILTWEDDCNKNWIFCFPSAFWPQKIKIFTTFILYCFTQNCRILMFYFISIGQNVDIYPSKRLLKLSVTKIGLSLSKPILSP